MVSSMISCIWHRYRLNHIGSIALFQVGDDTTSEFTQCLCNHATFFGSLNVKPNPISLPTLTALKKGYAMLIFVSVIFMFYFLGLIWVRRKDRADIVKVTPFFTSRRTSGDQPFKRTKSSRMKKIILVSDYVVNLFPRPPKAKVKVLGTRLIM